MLQDIRTAGSVLLCSDLLDMACLSSISTAVLLAACEGRFTLSALWRQEVLITCGLEELSCTVVTVYSALQCTVHPAITIYYK